MAEAQTQDPAVETPASPQTLNIATVTEQILGKLTTASEALRTEVKDELNQAIEQSGATLRAEAAQREQTWQQRFAALGQTAHRQKYSGHFASAADARKFGLLLLAKYQPNVELQQKAAADLKAAGVELHTAAVTPETGAGGGYLAIDTMIAEIIANIDDYGVSERLFRVFGDVGGEKVSRPKRGQGATVYFPDFGGAPSESALKVAKLQANLSRWSVFARYDRWMARSDLAVALAEYVADELRFALAVKQDECAFLGDGSDTFAKIMGVFGQPKTGHQVVTADSGDNTFAEVVAASNKYPAALLAALPRWVLKAGVTFLMDHTLFFSYWGLQDANGAPLIQFLGAQGQVPFRLMGYPVEFTGVGPTLTDATQNNVPVMAAGNWMRSYELYRHRSGMEMRQSEHLYLLEGDIAVVLDVLQTMSEVDANGYAVLWSNNA